MPPQPQASEASEARLSKVGTRPALTKPHLVSAEHWSARSLEEGVASADFGGPNVVERGGKSRVIAGGMRGRDGVAFLPSWSLHAISKRLLDIIGAVVLGLVFSPLILTVALLLRRQGGPVIYRHRRIGRGGVSFDCMKFRSMVPDAEHALRDLLERHPEIRAEWLSDHKLRCDPRVTRLGKFLRRTSLDELPQIWNVLRGEMSLVGPRPVVREELMRYGRSLPVYLAAKPGITGLWQVTGRNNTDYRRRVALDVYYVRKQSLLLDLYVLLKTPRVMVGGGGAY